MRVTDEQRAQHAKQFHSIVDALALHFRGVAWHNDANARITLSKPGEPAQGFHLWLDTWSAKAGFVTVTPMWPEDARGNVILPRDFLTDWSFIETAFNSARGVPAVVGQINRAFMPEYQRQHTAVVARIESARVLEQADSPHVDIKGVSGGEIYGEIFRRSDGTYRMHLEDVPLSVARLVLEAVRQGRK